MKETTHHNSVIVDTCLLAFILMAVTGMVVFPREARLGLAPAYLEQDPGVPASPPFVSLAPDNLDFGKQVVRRTSSPKRITVQNTGGKPLYFDSLVIGGDNPNSFAILKDTCTGATIDPGKACIVDITFTPSGTGTRNARLKLSDNALDSPQRLKLTGNGINSNDVPPF